MANHVWLWHSIEQADNSSFQIEIVINNKELNRNAFYNKEIISMIGFYEQNGE